MYKQVSDHYVVHVYANESEKHSTSLRLFVGHDCLGNRLSAG